MDSDPASSALPGGCVGNVDYLALLSANQALRTVRWRPDRVSDKSSGERITWLHPCKPLDDFPSFVCKEKGDLRQ